MPRIDTPRRVEEERSTATVSAPSVLDLTFVDLGTDGRFLAVGCNIAAWVTFYSSSAARTADAARPVVEDPPLSAGVLLDLSFDGVNPWLYPPPGTAYTNTESTLRARIFARVRTALLVPHAASVIVRALVEYDTAAS